MKEKVSIIIPCYNKGAYIKEALESSLSQTYPNIEIVCYNDGSSDNSSAVIQEFANKYSNFLFIDSKENKGVIAARNSAIENSSGVYILPLDADDKIAPTYVEKAVKILEENSSVGIVYCKAKKFGITECNWILPEYDETDFLYKNCIFVSALFRKSDFIKVGGFKQYMDKGLEDWDLWLSLLELGLKPYRINETLFFYRQISENTRTISANENSYDLFLNIIKNHTGLYLNNTDIAKRLLSYNPNKLLKHRKVIRKLIITSIIQLVLIFILVICLILK